MDRIEAFSISMKQLNRHGAVAVADPLRQVHAAEASKANKLVESNVRPRDARDVFFGSGGGSGTETDVALSSHNRNFRSDGSGLILTNLKQDLFVEK
jgi:hypothetical protein